MNKKIYLKVSSAAVVIGTFKLFIILVLTLYQSILITFSCLQTAERLANSIDPDQMLPSASSDLGLHFLLMCVCSNAQSKYGKLT